MKVHQHNLEAMNKNTFSIVNSIEQIKAYLWMGQTFEAISYLRTHQLTGATQFCNYFKIQNNRKSSDIWAIDLIIFFV